jgi:glycerol-3-phosphate dehydrogenase (NAD(P)+)
MIIDHEHGIISSMAAYSQIGIVGGGALGGALGARLSAVNLNVSYWDVNPKLRTATSLDDLVATCAIILVCTPSQTNRVIARDVAQVFPTGTGPAVLSLAKGVEPGFKTMDTVLREELGDRFVTGIISGPMLAAELAAGHTAGATVATTNLDATTLAASYLERAGLIVQTSGDLHGVALAGTLKNVFALGLGLIDGLDLGYNFKSVFTVKALEDFQAILALLGATPQLALGMAGLGDLLTTGWSGLSFNWRTGQAWAKGIREPKGEGINTLRQLAATGMTDKLIVIHALESIFLHGADPASLSTILSQTTANG